MTVPVVVSFHKQINKFMWEKKKNFVKKEKEHNKIRSRDLKTQ